MTNDVQTMLGNLQAGLLSQTTIQVQMLRRLRAKGVLSDLEVNELVDDALATLEKLQQVAPEHEQWIYELARGHVEIALPRIGGQRLERP